MRLRSAVAAVAVFAAGATPAHAANVKEQLLETGIEAVKSFDETYGCDVPTKVIIRDLGHVASHPSINSSYESFVAGTAKPGKIILDPRLIDFEKNWPGASRHTALHEAAHACTTKVRFEKPYFIKNANVNMIGAVGLKALGKNSNNKPTSFSLIEEGSTELLASNISGMYSNTESYKHLAEITHDLLTLSDISLKELQDYQEHSDLIGFVARVNGIKKRQVTEQILENLFSLYNQQLSSRQQSSQDPLN